MRPCVLSRAGTGPVAPEQAADRRCPRARAWTSCRWTWTISEPRLRLLSYVWADQADRMARVRGALELAMARPAAGGPGRRGGLGGGGAGGAAATARPRCSTTPTSLVLPAPAPTQARIKAAALARAGKRRTARPGTGLACPMRAGHRVPPAPLNLPHPPVPGGQTSGGWLGGHPHGRFGSNGSGRGLIQAKCPLAGLGWAAGRA